jgi:hypothetical protein
MDQLGGSVRWLHDHNSEVEALPVMLHRSRASDAKAIAVPGMRVITPELFQKLKNAGGQAGRPSGNSSRTRRLRPGRLPPLDEW